MNPRSAIPDLHDTLPQDADARERSSKLSERRGGPPSHVAGYRVVRCLGEGAFGSVWLAEEENTGKQVAIKFYSHSRGLDWSLLNREVEKLASLYTSREIIGLLSVGWNSTPPYYVMEYMEHGSLAKRLEQGHLPPADAVRIATTIIQALMHAHRQGILHCDVKPANVLLDAADAPRLADFGQSRLSDEQDPALGTLFYMAPEQADLSAIPNPRWDVYALGVLMYEMLTGEVPFKSPSAEQALSQAETLKERLDTYRTLIRQAPRPVRHHQTRGVDSQLADIVDRCLEFNPARRFANASQVMSALEERAHWRSRRPFILIPAFLLIVLVPVAWSAMSNAVRTAEENQAARALESDLVSAKILATALHKSLETRKFQLEQVAGDDRLRAALLAAAGRPMESAERQTLEEMLNEARQHTNELLREQGMALDDSWFLTDAVGIQRWRDPLSTETLDRDFRHRDYFHGLGREYSAKVPPADLKPIRSPHISRPYRSTTDGIFKLAISVPVWDLSEQKVIGVLARAIPLDRLLVEYKELVRNEEVQRVIGLVEYPSWQLLDHPWLTAENWSRLPEDLRQAPLVIPESQRARLVQLMSHVQKGEPTGRLEQQPFYIDPVGQLPGSPGEQYGGQWLAAVWPVPDTKWLAIVQEKRAAALQPVREIQQGLVTYALVGISACLAVVAWLWIMETRRFRAETSHRRLQQIARRRSGSAVVDPQATPITDVQTPVTGD